ncbi:prostaglandin reductase 2 [Rhinophrynus dorsalis]
MFCCSISFQLLKVMWAGGPLPVPLEDRATSTIFPKVRLQVATLLQTRLQTDFLLTASPGTRIEENPVAENFHLEELSVSGELMDGQVLVRTLYLALDPFMRCQMKEDPGTDIMAPFKINQVLEGGGIGVVEVSRTSHLTPGDLVKSDYWPWQTKCILDGKSLQKLDPTLVNGHITHFIGAAGYIGLTALVGLKVIGHVIPGAKQTIVVSSAAGACGSLAGQIARLLGYCRVVGICGSDQKCDMLVSELGFDIALNYKKEGLEEKLRESCPDGVDVYFDNVAGEIGDIVMKQMNQNSHIVLCGQLSQYNNNVLYPLPPSPESAAFLKERNISRVCFSLMTYEHLYESYIAQIIRWLNTGKLKVKETFVHGIENAVGGFIALMKGEKSGRQLVKISD